LCPKLSQAIPVDNTFGTFDRYAEWLSLLPSSALSDEQCLCVLETGAHVTGRPIFEQHLMLRARFRFAKNASGQMCYERARTLWEKVHSSQEAGIVPV
jgi:hypothetical protein